MYNIYIYIYIPWYSISTSIHINKRHSKITPRTQSRVASLHGQEQVDEAAAQVMMALLGSVTPDSRWLRSGELDDGMTHVGQTMP